MNTASLWQSITSKHQAYPALNEDIEVDVAIIGGGITGLTAALQLVQGGQKVAILEANRVGEGTTGYSTGNLYIAVQPYYQNIVSKFDLETAKNIAHSRKWAIDYIEQTAREKNIDCGFNRRPWFLYTDDQEKISFLDREVETFKKMGIKVEYVDSLPLSLKFKKAALMPNQARFNPLQYVLGLAEDLGQRNVQIFEGTRVTDIKETDVCVLSTAHGKVTAKKVIIATHTPIGVNLTQLFTAPYRSYVVGVRLKDNIYPEGHFWDLTEPHHAVCTHAVTSDQPELLLVAGSHHKTGQSNNAIAHYQELEVYLRQHFPVFDVEYRWSAQHYQPADGVPYIGLASRFAKHTYMATGYSADGLLYGTLAGMIISHLILKTESHLVPVYRSNRLKPLASATFLAKENLNIFTQYLKDFPFSAKTNYDYIRKGEGDIVELDGEKCGVFRDDENKVHIVSAVCTHMKCIVNWNNAEKTWDCPCHGSRFTTDGKVLEGPAVRDLKKVSR
jgi:glycine/D-amino acid oxidase-like deaminating enzyme/nitrite reductase/ring-hydroxylating ferredoxin subunit